VLFIEVDAQSVGLAAVRKIVCHGTLLASWMHQGLPKGCWTSLNSLRSGVDPRSGSGAPLVLVVLVVRAEDAAVAVESVTSSDGRSWR
jgi:hypothetical protein